MQPSPANYPTIGPYRVLGALGAGGVGQVLRVADPVGRELALKLLGKPGNQARDKRFAREGELTARLNHPGIVRVHGHGVSEAGPYLVYELIQGEDLERCFDRLTQEQQLQVLLQVADALGYAHGQGVIHRDVKPANVLVDTSGHAYLADFGMAQAVGLERLTLSGALVGTPRYMSPEQAGGERERYGPPTDVWALGVLLYRVLTGREPFSGGTMLQLLAQLTSERPAPPQGCSPGLTEVCLRALEKDPARRYADGTEFAQDLRRALQGESVIGRKPLAREGGSLKLTVTLGVALALVTGVALAVLSNTGLPTPPTAPQTQESPQTEESTPPDPKVAELRAALEALLGEAGPLEPRDVEAVHRLAAGNRPREHVLWREGTAGLAGLASPAELERALPLLELLAQLPEGARVDVGDDGRRVTSLGVRLAGELWLDGRPGLATPEEREGACLELLELLVALGWQLGEREAADRLLDELSICWQTGMIAESTYWWLVLAGVQLDVPLYPASTFFDPQGRTPREDRVRPWRKDTTDPWQRFVDLRITLIVENGEPRAPLREALEASEAFAGKPWSLGPRQWADAATYVVDQLGVPGFPLLEQALELDPASPYPHEIYGRWLFEKQRYDDAVVHTAAALELFQASYAGNLPRRWNHGVITWLHMRTLAKLERRDEARALYPLLREVGPGDAEKALQRFPWIQDE